jgi:hypothetical protein
VLKVALNTITLTLKRKWLFSNIVVLRYIFLVPSTPVFVHTFNSVCLAVILRGELGFLNKLVKGTWRLQRRLISRLFGDVHFNKRHMTKRNTKSISKTPICMFLILTKICRFPNNVVLAVPFVVSRRILKTYRLVCHT